MAVNVFTWFTVAEVAARLQTSEKTIMRYGDRRMIEVRKRPRVGKKPENVYNPADVEKLMPAAHVMPREIVPAVRNVSAPAPRLQIDTLLERIANTIETRMIETKQTSQIPAVEIVHKLWLTLDEAAAYSGFARERLHAAITAGELRGEKRGPHGAWIVPRAALEAFAQ